MSTMSAKDWTKLAALLNQMNDEDPELEVPAEPEEKTPEGPVPPESVFEVLSAVNVNEYLDEKKGLKYLSWAWAWDQLKKHYPDSTYKVYEDENGWIYHTDGRTAWVKVGVTVRGMETVEYLPVMDYRNNSIPLEKITSTDVNKAIQRALVKAIARHGLGLYVYAGEDLPEGGKPAPTVQEDRPATAFRSRAVVRRECIEEYRKLGKKPEDLAKDFGVTNDTTRDEWEQVLAAIRRKA